LLVNVLVKAFRQHVHATIGSPFLDTDAVNTFPLKLVTTIEIPLLNNGAVNRLRQQ
jgi:hypothetical protein